MKKMLLGLVITLILGALGSGLWELAFRPLLSLFANFALNVVTLGLDSLRNGLYQDAAKGQYDRIGIALLSSATGLLIAITGTSIFQRFPFLSSKMQRVRQDQAYGKWWLLTFVFITTLIVFMLQRISYVTEAANYFDQLVTIAGPYLSDQERIIARSKFAQVQTREQYVSLISELQSTSREHGASVPHFRIY